MLIALALLVMLASALVGGWAYRNSRKEREEVGKAMQELSVSIESALRPLGEKVARLLRR